MYAKNNSVKSVIFPLLVRCDNTPESLPQTYTVSFLNTVMPGIFTKPTCPERDVQARRLFPCKETETETYTQERWSSYLH